VVIIPALQRLRQEDLEFQASLGFLDPISKERISVLFG
jgi:hypothetical protein